MGDVTQSLELLFDRPGETMLTPKGEENALFLLSEELLPKDYQNNGIEINNRFGENATQTIPLQNLAQLPRFTKANKLPFEADFSTLIPAHQEMADEVIDALMNVPENQLQQFLSTCVYSRVNLNPQLFNYCYSVALMHRRDTRNIRVKNFAETFPSKFMDSKVFAQARESAAVSARGAPRRPIIIPRDYTATDLDIEHRLAYFREDVGVNLHHWHWHLVYPFSANNNREIVAKDRRGELFFYMHQQIIARYNGERLNNALARVKKLSKWREPIPEAYFPKLDSLTSARGWPPRQANMRWQDLDRPADNLRLSVADMERWRNAVEETIATGLVQLPDGSTQPLDIDTLGNMIESSILSPNPALYGSLHNNGHTFIAYMHDPNHRYLESFGVIADEGTTMRDPVFYRWHAFIDDLFQRHKESPHVRPYARSELENEGVRVTSASVESATGETNILNTFWTQSDIDMSRGLDFSDRGPVYVRFTHLNHRPFRYVNLSARNEHSDHTSLPGTAANNISLSFKQIKLSEPQSNTNGDIEIMSKESFIDQFSIASQKINETQGSNFRTDIQNLERNILYAKRNIVILKNDILSNYPELDEDFSSLFHKRPQNEGVEDKQKNNILYQQAHVSEIPAPQYQVKDFEELCQSVVMEDQKTTTDQETSTKETDTEDILTDGIFIKEADQPADSETNIRDRWMSELADIFAELDCEFAHACKVTSELHQSFVRSSKTIKCIRNILEGYRKKKLQWKIKMRVMKLRRREKNVLIKIWMKMREKAVIRRLEKAEMIMIIMEIMTVVVKVIKIWKKMKRRKLPRKPVGTFAPLFYQRNTIQMTLDGH